MKTNLLRNAQRAPDGNFGRSKWYLVDLNASNMHWDSAIWIDWLISLLWESYLTIRYGLGWGELRVLDHRFINTHLHFHFTDKGSQPVTNKGRGITNGIGDDWYTSAIQAVRNRWTKDVKRQKNSEHQQHWALRGKPCHSRVADMPYYGIAIAVCGRQTHSATLCASVRQAST